MWIHRWLTWAWTRWWVWRSARSLSATMTSSCRWGKSASLPLINCEKWWTASQWKHVVLRHTHCSNDIWTSAKVELFLLFIFFNLFPCRFSACDCKEEWSSCFAGLWSEPAVSQPWQSHCGAAQQGSESSKATLPCSPHRRLCCCIQDPRSQAQPALLWLAVH